MGGEGKRWRGNRKGGGKRGKGRRREGGWCPHMTFLHDASESTKYHLEIRLS